TCALPIFRDADGSDSILELNGNSVEQEEVRILRGKRQLIPSTRRGIHLRWSAAAAAQVRRVEVHEPSPPLQRRNSVVAQAVEDLRTGPAAVLGGVGGGLHSLLRICCLCGSPSPRGGLGPGITRPGQRVSCRLARGRPSTRLRDRGQGGFGAPDDRAPAGP